ncbi:MAG: cation diffusion facilitator family transporter [Muribaculaceae bacterium]|nr:cation diffusion facilitator family transporter [Muribaculaceae bacterium]
MNPTVKAIRHVTVVGIWINVALVVLKLFFGYWGQSDALVADGYHSMSDFVTDFIVIIFVAASYKKADHDHPYGHGKFETIATVLIGLILLGVGAFIGYEGAVTLIKAINGEVLPTPDIWTLYVAIASIALKEFCFRYTLKYGKKLDSPSLMANAWHHRSDAISSVATLVGVSLAIFLGHKWAIAAPIASILIAVMICVSAVKIAIPPLNELLEASLPPETITEMYRTISQVPGVLKAHNLRSRKNGHSYIVDVNIHVRPDITVSAGHEIATAVERTLEHHYGKDMIIYVHTEPQK